METAEIVFLVMGLIWLVLNIVGTVVFCLNEGKTLLFYGHKWTYAGMFALFLLLLGFIRAFFAFISLCQRYF